MLMASGANCWGAPDPAAGCWALLGQLMQRVLTDAARLRAFNLCMAALLVGSLYPVVVK